MAEGGSFRKHLNDFNEVTDQLTSVNITFSDEIRALLVLGQLPESWRGIVTAISSSAGKSSLKFDDVVSMILTEEIRMQSYSASTSGSALMWRTVAEIQTEEMNEVDRPTVASQRTGGPSLESSKIPRARRQLSVGNVGRLGTTKINARVGRMMMR